MKHCVFVDPSLSSDAVPSFETFGMVDKKMANRRLVELAIA